MEFDEEKIFLRIKKSDKWALKELMDEYNEQILNWAQRNFSGLSIVEFEDSYAEAIIKLHEKIISGKFELSKKYSDDNNSLAQKPKLEVKRESIKSFLFTVVKNDLINIVNKKNRHRDHEGKVKLYIKDSFKKDSPLEKEDKQKVIKEAMDKLPESYRKTLTLFYFDGFSMESIAEKLGFENKDVAKTTKYNALKRLREIITNQLNKEDII